MEEPPLPALEPDALVQIFYKLPPRSVFHCEQVCRQWRSLISNPIFRSTYNPSSISDSSKSVLMIPQFREICHPNRQVALNYDIDNSGNFPMRHEQRLPGDFKWGDDTKILGSWNGLVALYKSRGNFSLFNPCTGDEKSVYVTMADHYYWYEYDEYTLYGLCHDQSCDEYKALLFVSSLFGGNYGDGSRFHVVSFKDGSCKFKTQPTLKGLWPFQTCLGTVIKGIPHWVCETDSRNSLLYFDVGKEEFQMIRPPQMWGRKKILGLGDLDGCMTVAVATLVGNQSVGGLEVWAMKRYGKHDSWSKIFVVLNELNSLSILSRVNEDQILMDANRKELVILDLRKQTLRKLPKKMRRSRYDIVTYTPTLVSPTQ